MKSELEEHQIALCKVVIQKGGFQHSTKILRFAIDLLQKPHLTNYTIYKALQTINLFLKSEIENPHFDISDVDETLLD